MSAVQAMVLDDSKEEEEEDFDKQQQQQQLSSIMDDNDDNSQEDDDDEEVEDGDDVAEDDSDDDDDDNSSVFDSEDEQELAALAENMQAQAQQAQARLKEAAQQEWRDLLTSVQTRQTTVLKITDSQMIGLVFSSQHNDGNDGSDSNNNNNNNNSSNIVETRVEALLAATDRPQQQQQDEQQNQPPVLTHVILSQAFLQRLDRSLQTRLFATMFRQHATSLAYIRLVADADESSGATIGATKVLHYMPNVLHTSAWLTPLSSSNNMNHHVNVLTEMEIRTLDISSPGTVQQLVLVLKHNEKSLRQVNWLGMHLDDKTLNSCKGLLDPIVEFITENMSQLDELRLQVLLRPCIDDDNVHDANGDRAHLVTHGALERLLIAKPKWWRLGLDGVGLDDGHVTVLSRALASGDHCRVGDLLSLTDNPRISDKAMRDLFVNVLYNKARMGLVQVAVGGTSSGDTASPRRHTYWEHQFDLVRPLNNVHGRLTAIQNGAYTDPQKWTAWLHKLSTLKWLDDAHKINYICFTLLEKPEMIKLHNK